MTSYTTVPDAAQLGAAARLRDLVPELIAVTLDAKQAHWNTVGPSFLPLHDLTEDLANDSRMWTDRVAERAVALGLAVDGRPATVATVDRGFPSGLVADVEMVTELHNVLLTAADAARDSLRDLELNDAVGHDIVVEVLEGLDKYRWMLRAHAS